MHKVKRERVRETMDQTQTQVICFEVRATALRSRLHIEGFPIHYLVHTGLPTQGTSTEDLGNTITESTQLLSQVQHNLYTEARHNSQHLYT